MNHLLRELAPIGAGTWQLIDDEAKERLTPALAARKLVDFSGPHGWEHSSTNLGRVEPLASVPVGGVTGARRKVLPLVELRVDFTLSREELQTAERGAEDTDLGPLDDAARQLAQAENVAVLTGWADAITGIGEAATNAPVPLPASAQEWPNAVAAAVAALLEQGVAGPYGLALGTAQYRRALETAEGGAYPLTKHLARIIEGPIVWAPGLEGGIVVSQRGGDFLFESGQDIAVGYDGQDGDDVRFYLQESFSFRVATPEAAVVLPA